MGVTGSRPHDDTEGTGKIHRRTLPKKYSAPAALTYQMNTKNNFYPPPILHTKFCQLDQLSLVDDDRRVAYSTNGYDTPSYVLHRRDLLDNIDLVTIPGYTVQNTSSSCGLLSDELSVSSTSSGVDSDTGEELDLPVETSNHPAEMCSKELSSDTELRSSAQMGSQRLSMDSGGSFDDNTVTVAATGLEPDTFETVFEEGVTEGDKSESRAKNSKLSSKKGRKKYSIIKSLRKMRSRAASMPTLQINQLIKRGDKLSSGLLSGGTLNREWEIVSVNEMCRRLSLDQVDQVILPLPDGAASSQILDETMIRQLVDVLPARASGYPWVNIYNSEKHGFSLHTFYRFTSRKMMEWDQEMSPVLLIIRDCGLNVFGAIVSTTIKPNEYFFGTGDSCFLFKFVEESDCDEKELRVYRWTGENQYFVKASRDSLSVGSSGGHCGLWLDADLNHGRSERCDTFRNEPLVDTGEDFTIQFVEAFGFCMA